jgi:hypothetical protein
MTYSDLHSAAVAPSSLATPAVGADGSPGKPAAGPTDVLRTVLWVVLGLSVIGNVVASITGAGAGPHLLFGALSALSGITLGIRFLRARG